MKESKHRFLCKVLIANDECECHIASSSKLGQFIKLENKKVLLTLNKGKHTRTKYTIFAVMYRNKYIMLNLNLVNRLFKQSTTKDLYQKYEGLGNCVMEANVDGYKADLFFKEEKLIIENKAIISTRKEALFPTVFSERAILQLKKLNVLLSLGYKVIYNIISLSPSVKVIDLNVEQTEFYKNFNECVASNMEVRYYSMIFANGQVVCKELKMKTL